MSITHIVFDLGGVLFHWRPEVLAAEVFPSPEEQRLIADKFYRHPDWLELDRGTLGVDGASARAAQRTGLDADRIATLLRRIPGHLTINEGTKSLLGRLASEGHRLYCLSNMHSHTAGILEAKLDVWEAFDGVIFSCKVGVIKPEPAIYQILLERFGLDPAETVFIDDMVENLEAAARFGIEVIHFRSADQCARELAALGCLRER